MMVKNVTAREIFLGVGSRQIRDIEEARRGIRFPVGIAIFVPDRVSFIPQFESLRLAGSLVVESYDPSQSSVLTHAEDSTGLGALVTDTFTPTVGQTVFLLSAAYLPGGFSEADVNGVLYESPVDYVISGTTLVWTNAAFSLDSSDELTVTFES